MNTIAQVRFNGRLLVQKEALTPTQTQETPVENVDTPPAATGLSAENIMQVLGPKWEAGDLSEYEGDRFVQLRTARSIDPEADLAAADRLMSEGQDGIAFAYAPSHERSFQLANDRRTSDRETVRQRIRSGQPVAYVVDPKQQSPKQLFRLNTQG